MNLAIFDLDGTLTDTNEIDIECFAATWKGEFGVDTSNLDWSSFQHITDTGIALALCEKYFEIPERQAAYDRVRRRFIDALVVAASRKPGSFRAVRGAREMLPALAASNWSVVIATGAWGEAARIKLAAAGFEEDIPLSSSDCCISREEIVRHAMRIAGLEYACPFEHTVLFGDAPWDVATAAKLRVPFVGIAPSNHAPRLSLAGAGVILPDFSDIDALKGALDTARVPFDS